jgi:hypothetical protein
MSNPAISFVGTISASPLFNLYIAAELDPWKVRLTNNEQSNQTQ